MVRFKDGRYEAPLLWATDHPDMPNNHAVALSRFQILGRALKKTSAKTKAYEATIEDYLNQNHAKKLLTEEKLEGSVGRTVLYKKIRTAIFFSKSPLSILRGTLFGF